MMAEVGFPDQHSNTTTVTYVCLNCRVSTTVGTNIRFDTSYIKTMPGILKIVQVLCSFIGFMCVITSWYGFLSSSQFFNWISMIAFCFTGILLGFYLFHILEKFYEIPWLKIEFAFCALWTFFFVLASILLTTKYDDQFIAAAFFGCVAAIAYAIDCHLKWVAIRSGGLAQGTRDISEQKVLTEKPLPPKQDIGIIAP